MEEELQVEEKWMKEKEVVVLEEELKGMEE